jgi:iron(III) transport system substrate-binding protein
MTPDQEAAWKQVEDAARKEGKFTYYGLGSIPQNQLDKLKALFAKDYPEVQIEYLFIGNNAAVMARIGAKQESKNYVADVAEAAPFNVLQADDRFFQSFVPPAARDQAVKWAFDPLGPPEAKQKLMVSMRQYFPMWINTNLVKPANAPKTYQDVLDPHWKGQIMLRQPWSTGGGNHLYIFAKQVYGQEWVTKMQAQQPTFGADQDAALLQVARGEYALGLGLTGRTASQLMRDGQPIAVAWPQDFVVTVGNGTALASNAPHANAAKVFINWMLTQPGQQLWRDLAQYPARADAPPIDQWMQGFAGVKQTFEDLLTTEQQEASLQEAAADFRK